MENTEKGIELNVNYSRTVQEMINAGRFYEIDREITESHFPIPSEIKGKKVSVLVKLFHFGQNIYSDVAIAEINKAGYRPATLAELLSLSETYPQLQKQFPIVALGSKWIDHNGVKLTPVIYSAIFRRNMLLGCFDSYWNRVYRFLAVCE